MFFSSVFQSYQCSHLLDLSARSYLGYSNPLPVAHYSTLKLNHTVIICISTACRQQEITQLTCNFMVLLGSKAKQQVSTLNCRLQKKMTITESLALFHFRTHIPCSYFLTHSLSGSTTTLNISGPTGETGGDREKRYKVAQVLISGPQTVNSFHNHE